MPYKNKEEQRKSWNRWYSRNQQKQMDANRKRIREFDKWFSDYKRSLVCADCGMYFNIHPECCDFHHIEDNKDNNIANIHTKGAMIKELKKCIPLCANCHRIRHSIIGG